MPDEGFRVLIVVFDKIFDGSFELFGLAADAAPKLSPCEQGKPAFHQVSAMRGRRRQR